VSKPIPIAFSILERFINCPKSFHDVKVTHEFGDRPHADNKWGNYAHKEFQTYLEMQGTTVLPENLSTYKKYLDGILRQPGEMHVEWKQAIDTHLNECDFWSKSCFMRGVADVVHLNGTTASILDHKMGKRKPHSRQMKMAALLMFLVRKDVQRCRVAFAWLKVNKFDAEEFTRADIPNLWNEFIPDIKQYKEAFEKDIWQARQTGLCKQYCPVVTCKFNGAQHGWGPDSLKPKQPEETAP
jgi:hypothetical protein